MKKKSNQNIADIVPCVRMLSMAMVMTIAVLWFFEVSGWLKILLVEFMLRWLNVFGGRWLRKIGILLLIWIEFMFGGCCWLIEMCRLMGWWRRLRSGRWKWCGCFWRWRWWRRFCGRSRWQRLGRSGFDDFAFRESVRSGWLVWFAFVWMFIASRFIVNLFYWFHLCF